MTTGLWLDARGASSDLLSAPAATDERAAVLVRAGVEQVLAALAPFADGIAPRDVTDDLARGRGLDDVFDGRLGMLERKRAVVVSLRGARATAILREGGADAAHDVPLARRVSAALEAPALALRVAGRDVAFELFHRGRALESILTVAGQLVVADSAFRDLDERAVASDPYGRIHDLLGAYGLTDDRLSFEDFVAGDHVLLRWDLTIERAIAFERLAPWPRAEISAELATFL
jgi:hypothetical protein